MSLSQARLRFVVAVVLYGTVGPITRFIDLPSEVVVLFRGTLGSLFVLAFLHARGRALDWAAIRSDARWLVASGLCLGLNWIFLFAAYAHTTIAIASLCNYMAPIIVIAISPIAFGERVGPRRLACVAVAFLGIVLVSDIPSAISGEVDLFGVMLGLAAALAFVGIIVCNKRLEAVDAYDRVVVQLAISAMLVLPYALVVNGGTLPLGEADALSWCLLALLCLVQTGVAYVFYFGAMRELPVQEISLMGYIEPVVSVLGSALFLHESLSAMGLLGAVLVIAAASVGETVRE